MIPKSIRKSAISSDMISFVVSLHFLIGLGSLLL